MSIGAGGMPRTVVAGGPQALMNQGQPQMQPQMPQQMQPQMPQQMQPPQMQQQPMHSSANAKTMIAAPSPFAQGGPNLPGLPPNPQMGQQMNGGMQPQPSALGASPMQKTIVAAPAPQIVNGQLVQPNGMPNGMQPHNGMQPSFPPPAGSSPNKTVMLQPSEGVVSVASMSGQSLPAAGVGQAMPQPGPEGVLTLFWIVSLVIGVAVGALAYVVVLQL